MKKSLLLLVAMTIALYGVYAQKVQRDKAIFKEYQPGFYINSIMKDVRMVEEKSKPAKMEKRFKIDMTDVKFPNQKEMYKFGWHNNPISQGNTGTCWCFSATSMYESEVYRLYNMKVKLSEMYIAYWEYVEKATRYVKERGNSEFGQGSECNAVQRIFKKYGVAPAESYTGLKTGQKFYNHDPMFNEMKAFLESLKSTNNWNEEMAIATIKSIMNHYMGVPPTDFLVDGKKLTPLQYLNDYLKIRPDDYVEILSYMQEPYYEKVEYTVPDNWWHSADYYNVPLDVYMKTLKAAIRKGFTVAIGGDVSEAGLDGATQCAVVPTFDIPSEYIDENARQMRFSNGATTDDHGMHLVGFAEKDAKDWYLIKDSSAGSRNNGEDLSEFGYYFFHEDFVKLKMMSFTVHKDAVPEILKKVNETQKQ